MTFDKGKPKRSDYRNHDLPTPEGLKKIMETGWAPTPLEGLKKSPATPYAVARVKNYQKLFQINV